MWRIVKYFKIISYRTDKYKKIVRFEYIYVKTFIETSINNLTFCNVTSTRSIYYL